MTRWNINHERKSNAEWLYKFWLFDAVPVDCLNGICLCLSHWGANFKLYSDIAIKNELCLKT